MATIVLTAVGAALGGPIGAAIGAFAGQAIDRELLFKPKGREGPRLAELSVQTSTYGAPIPRLFGTMRVAGQVIWATDLKEQRDREGGGKGRPSTTTYSYSASFAVLLSARRIGAVRRIWADGKLLRGAAGDWKTRTGFRLHLGGEDQAPDPLIAAAEGAGAIPAMRGQACAVFEDLALADFGNRIPSITFEVEADSGPVAIGAIVEALGEGAIRSTLALPVGGYAAHGDTLRAAIDPLLMASGALVRAAGGGLAIETGRDGGTIADAGARIPGRRGEASTRDIAALERVPRRITVAHYDPARDYQIGAQDARRDGPGTRAERLELAAALDAASAKTIAEGAMARALAKRATRMVRLPWSPGMAQPGDIVTVAGDDTRWRVRSMGIERMVSELALERAAAASALPLPASPGRVLGEDDSPAGATRIEAFELPPLEDTLATRPLLALAVCGGGPGWRGAELMVRGPDGAWVSAGQARVPAVIGTLAQPLAPAHPALVDRANAIEVTLAHDGIDLADADTAALRAGANLALVGDELIQFGRAQPLGAARWWLSELWRARRCTEAALRLHATGTRFVLVEAAALVVHPLAAEAIGTPVEAAANGIGDAGLVLASAAVTGRSVAPPAPVHARVRRIADGSLTIGWTRRSRLGWSWRDGIDAPLGEAAERYRLTVVRADGMRRTVELATPLWTYPADVFAGDRAAGPVTLDIRQVGDLAPSPPLIFALEDE